MRSKIQNSNGYYFIKIYGVKCTFNSETEKGCFGIKANWFFTVIETGKRVTRLIDEKSIEYSITERVDGCSPL